MNLPLTNTRRTLIHSIRITKVVVPDHVPVSRRPGTMCCVSGLRRDTVETITLLPQEVLGRSYCRPRLLDVSDMTKIRILLVFRNPVIIRSDVGVG